MGQTVAIRDFAHLGDTLLIDTDRSFTGQDGQTLDREMPEHSVLGRLASALFGLDLRIDHVYVLQNTISVRRQTAWDEAGIDGVRRAISEFLRFYED